MHSQEEYPYCDNKLDSFAVLPGHGFSIEQLSVKDAQFVVSLIRKNLADFPEAGSVLAATFRRLERLVQTYVGEGSRFFVVKNQNCNTIVGGAGLGPMAGLPYTEGVGEVRDMVLDTPYRSRGLGRMLLQRCISEARALHYKRIYLETTPQMEKARKLFTSFGFKPVEQRLVSKDSMPGEQFPCYFVLDLTPIPPEAIED